MKEPKNFRRKKVRVCAFCEQHGNDGYGGWYCLRSKEPDECDVGGDVGDMFDYESVCDYFEHFNC